VLLRGDTHPGGAFAHAKCCCVETRTQAENSVLLRGDTHPGGMMTLLRIKNHNLIFFFIVGFSNISFGFNLDNIKDRAIFIVHADLYDFYYSDSIHLKEIHNRYLVTELKSVGIENCVFLEVKLKDSTVNCNCSFVIAYWNDEKRFFRISGFRFSEFTIFFNLVLLDRYLENSNKVSIRKMKKAILSHVSLEKYNFSDLYIKFYKNFENFKNSCFQRKIINIYN
jgi:hypothetical protein